MISNCTNASSVGHAPGVTRPSRHRFPDVNAFVSGQDSLYRALFNRALADESSKVSTNGHERVKSSEHADTRLRESFESWIAPSLVK